MLKPQTANTHCSSSRIWSLQSVPTVGAFGWCLQSVPVVGANSAHERPAPTAHANYPCQPPASTIRGNSLSQQAVANGKHLRTSFGCPKCFRACTDGHHCHHTSGAIGHRYNDLGSCRQGFPQSAVYLDLHSGDIATVFDSSQKIPGL